MPFFGNKFSPKKTPPRKSLVSLNSEEPLEELVAENGTINIKLGDQECIFKNGEWVPESGECGNTQKSNRRMQNRMQQLEEENNMLRLRYEVLLNMLAQTTAESHIQQKEIEKLQQDKLKNKQ